jgi:hypothetical protein
MGRTVLLGCHALAQDDGWSLRPVKRGEQNDMSKAWLRQLLEAVSECWEWHTLALHIGVQYHEPDDADDGWEVWVYPAVQEILGGKNDGETGWCGFNFDLASLLEEFPAEHVSAITRMEDDPPQIVVEGKFREKALVLHVCLEPPEDVEPTEIIDLTTPGGASVREKQ